MKELKDFRTAKRALEQKLKSVEEELREFVLELALLRDDGAFNQGAAEKLKKKLEKSLEIKTQIKENDEVVIKIIDYEAVSNHFKFDGVSLFLSSSFSYEEQKAIIKKLGFDKGD